MCLHGTSSSLLSSPLLSSPLLSSPVLSCPVLSRLVLDLPTKVILSWANPKGESLTRAAPGTPYYARSTGETGNHWFEEDGGPDDIFDVSNGRGSLSTRISECYEVHLMGDLTGFVR